jgi:Flp pilus assembly protein TadG
MTRRHRGDEEGSALVETAIVLSLLMVLAIGAFEWGMAFRDWLSVSSATREGARVAASAGTTGTADCAILEATAGSLLSVDNSKIAFVDIYHADSSGAPTGEMQRYKPFDTATDSVANLRCVRWFAVNDTAYPPSNRDNLGAERDWVGVRLEFTHTWKTGLFWWSGGVTWSDRTIILMEPDPNI